MTKFEGCYLTNAGLEMVYNTGLERITFTRVVTGSGLYESKEDIPEMIQLKDQKQEFGLEGFSKGEDNTINVKFKVRNAGLMEQYQLSEIGIYAKGDDNEEKLYCVAYAEVGNTETVPAEAEDSHSIEYVTLFNIETVVSTDANVEVVYAEDHRWVAEYIGGILGEMDEKKGTFAQQLEAMKNEISTTNDELYQQLTGYTDEKIAELINGAPTTLDTLGEIASAMQSNGDVVDALNAAIGSKASEAEFNSHCISMNNRIGNVDISGIGDGTITGAIKEIFNRLGGLSFAAKTLAEYNNTTHKAGDVTFIKS